MSSYNENHWKDSPETEITAEKLNNQEQGIKDAHDGENIPLFTSCDNAEEVKEVLEVDSIANGDKLNIILSKLTKFANNVRWLFNFLKPTEVQGKGYESLPDVVSDVKDLNDRDYELGTDSDTGWTYRKWNNGFAELWRMCNPAYANGNVLNSYYEFPFTLTSTLTANGTLNTTNNSSGQLHGNVKVIIQKAGATVSVHDALGGYTSTTVKDVSVAVTGWWKQEVLNG